VTFFLNSNRLFKEFVFQAFTSFLVINRARYNSLQDAYSKLLPELTEAMKTIDEMKLKEVNSSQEEMIIN